MILKNEKLRFKLTSGHNVLTISSLIFFKNFISLYIHELLFIKKNRKE